MGLNRLAARTLAARPLRSFLTIVGVALGVGVLSASLTMGAGLDAAIDRTVRDLVGRADLRVSAFLELGLSDQTVDTIRATEGVAIAAPTVERRTFLAPITGRPVTGPVTVLGVDPGPYGQLHPMVLLAGAQLIRPNEASAIITETLASADGYVVGSEVTIHGVGAPAHLRVIGILAGAGPLAGSAGRTLIVPLEIARAVFGLAGVSRVDLGLESGVSSTVAAGYLADRLSAEPYVLASPADLAAGLRASTADFQATAALIAAIVLFVGAFLIINAMSMTVAERAREVGLLRAAGATRGQVVRFVLAGAAILGLLGSLLGVLMGAALGALVAGSIRSLTGFVASVDPVSNTSLVLAFAVGLGITVVAAIEPAIRAARISPVEALRAQLDLPAARRGRLGWLVVVFALVGIMALLVWPPAAGSVGVDRALAVYGTLLFATLGTPFILPPLARLVGWPLALVVRLEERLARGSLARDRSRAALTLGALVVGLSMVVALSWTAQAARERATAWLLDVVPGDELVTSIRAVAAGEGVEEALAAVPGVANVTPIGTFDLAVRGRRVDAAAIVGADFLHDGRLTFVAGDRAAALQELDGGGTVILPRAVAERLGLAVGDRITLALGGGSELELRISGVVERSIPSGGGEAILVGWPDASGPIGVAGADVFAVRFAPDAPSSAHAALAAVASGLALETNSLSQVQGAVSDALGRVFGLFDALALVAVFVAGIGILNTLAMGVLERTREIGVLRAIGMSRRQASRMLVVEGIVLGLVGTLLGALVGLAVGFILLALTGGFDTSMPLPWGSIGLAAALGLASSVIASYYPSRLASRVSIVRALQLD